MIYLLDVNVLIALAWPLHAHHQSARSWFLGIGKQGWATCPLTELGFVRIVSNARLVGASITPAEATLLLQQGIAVGNHYFWPDDLSPTTTPGMMSSVKGHKQVTDAYLLQLAAQRQGKLATFDQGVAALLSIAHQQNPPLELLSP